MTSLNLSKRNLMRATALPLIGLISMFTLVNYTGVQGSSAMPSLVKHACAQATPNLTVRYESRNNDLGTAYGDNTTVNPGQYVGYYFELHNTVEGTTAENALLKINLPTGEGTTFTSTATFSATNANTATDSTTVTLSSPGRLEFVTGSVFVKWDRNGDGDFEAGEDSNGYWLNGDSLVNGIGINFGNQNGCNAYIIQGTLLVKTVGGQTTPTPTPTTTVTPTPTGTVVTATPTQGQPGQEQKQQQQQTQNNNQTVNITNNNTPAVVLGVQTPPIQPKSGAETAVLALLAGLVPAGHMLRKFSQKV